MSRHRNISIVTSNAAILLVVMVTSAMDLATVNNFERLCAVGMIADSIRRVKRTCITHHIYTNWMLVFAILIHEQVLCLTLNFQQEFSKCSVSYNSVIPSIIPS